MASFLNQLQKKKAAGTRRGREAVLRPVSDTIDREIEAGLDDLFAMRESQEKAARSNKGGTKVSLKRPTVESSENSNAESELLTGHDDSIPWWLREPPKGNPQVEALTGIACKKVLAQLSAGVVESEQLKVVSTAVAEAAESLKHELRISRRVLEQTEEEILSLLRGKGPLSPLFEDHMVTEIFVDGCLGVRVVRDGNGLESPFRFRSADEFVIFVESLCRSIGRGVDDARPWMNAVLNDTWKTRVCVLHPSIHDGNNTRLCFRIPRPRQTSMFEILQAKAVPPTVAAWLSELIAAREANILVVGPAGAGKTMMLSALLSASNSEERIVVVENFPEIAVPAGNIEKLISRPAEGTGTGEILASELLQLARTRDAHRVVLGDIDAENATALLQALEGGWPGALASLQAENATDALWRVFDMASSAGGIAGESLMRRIIRSIHLIITMKRVEGTACVEEIAEVLRTSEGNFQMLPVVRFVGVQSGKRQWQLLARNSYWIQKLKERGVVLLPGPNLQSVRDDENQGSNDER